MQLKYSCISNVPLSVYGEDFSFIVNGEEFKTSMLISDLLSPKICQIQSNDPTFCVFYIDTQSKGNFSNILNLLNFNQNPIPENELPFVLEVIKIIGNESIEYHDQSKPIEITVDNVFSLIQQHEDFPSFYFKRLSDEIDFISSHFSEICEDHIEELKTLHLETLMRILSNSKLQLLNEDQLLTFVNSLYSENSMYSILYEYVYFINSSAEVIAAFVDVYDVNDISAATWARICRRLKQEVQPEMQEERYKLKGINFEYSEGNHFSGILNHLKNKSSGNISNAVNFSASSIYSDCVPQNLVLYDDQSKFFHTHDKSGSWVCLDFKELRVCPTKYSIRTDPRYGENNYHLKSWVIQVSNDNNSWKTIDEQKDCPHLNGQGLVYTFTIKNKMDETYQYIRLLQTGTNWHNDNYLIFGSFEIFGRLI